MSFLEQKMSVVPRTFFYGRGSSGNCLRGQGNSETASSKHCSHSPDFQQFLQLYGTSGAKLKSVSLVERKGGVLERREQSRQTLRRWPHRHLKRHGQVRQSFGAGTVPWRKMIALLALPFTMHTNT